MEIPGVLGLLKDSSCRGCYGDGRWTRAPNQERSMSAFLAEERCSCGRCSVMRHPKRLLIVPGGYCTSYLGLGSSRRASLAVCNTGNRVTAPL